MTETVKHVAPPKPANVAEYLTWMMNLSGKSQVQIAKEAGFPKSNVLSMMKRGDTKIPLEKVGKLAAAIGADPIHLFQMVMAEYYPSTWLEIQKMIGQPVLSDSELELLEVIRSAKVVSPKIHSDDDRRAVLDTINKLKPEGSV